MALLGRTCAGMLISGLWLAAAMPALAQRPAGEDQIKAVFLYNFVKYITWPDQAAGSSVPLRICVPANPPFFALVRAVVDGETVEGRPLAAVAPAGLDEARQCHLLYVGNSATADARSWVAAARAMPVVTVGDGPAGDIAIAFVRDQNRVRFDVDRAVAARHGVSISSKLLRIARRVQD